MKACGYCTTMLPDRGNVRADHAPPGQGWPLCSASGAEWGALP